jgi:hypothetical protein
MFGGTCARKGARQDAKSQISLTTNNELHLTHQLGHGSNVALKHYENAREYNSAMPSNLLQASTDAKLLGELAESVTVRPSFDHPEFFDQTRTKLLHELPPSKEFLMAYARDPKSDLEPTFYCLGVGCTKIFLHYMDWRLHMSSECDSTLFRGCNWCNSVYENTSYKNFWQGHLYSCKKKPASTIKLKPIVDLTANKCECGKSFNNKRNLARHKSRDCKLPNKSYEMMREESDDDEKKPKAKMGTVAKKRKSM